MFETALEEDEIIQAIAYPIMESAAYVKFPNPASRYATVGVFITRHGDDIKVAITGAAASVFRCDEMESALTADFSVDALNGIELDSEDMNNDMHASNEYRAHLCVVMAKRAVAKMLA